MWAGPSFTDRVHGPAGRLARRRILHENRFETEAIGPAGLCSSQHLSGRQRLEARLADGLERRLGENFVRVVRDSGPGYAAIRLDAKTDRRVALYTIASCDRRILRKRGVGRNTIRGRIFEARVTRRRFIGHGRCAEEQTGRAGNRQTAGAGATAADPRCPGCSNHRFRLRAAPGAPHPCTWPAQFSASARPDSGTRRPAGPHPLCRTAQ